MGVINPIKYKYKNSSYIYIKKLIPYNTKLLKYI